MPTNGEKEGQKPEKKKKPASEPLKKLKVRPELAIVQDAIRLMDASQINELSFEQKGVKVHLRKGPGAPFANTVTPAFVEAPRESAVSSPAATAPAAKPASKEDNFITLTAPMVGTFYRSPSPDAKPFLEEGGTLEAGQVYCIIEAMKLMNEVKSEVAGRVVRFLVQNGQAIEFNQPLAVLDPGK